MTYTPQNRRTPGHPAGESNKLSLRVNFDRRMKLEFQGSKITTDAGLLAYRELDDALELTDAAGDVFADSRTGQERMARHERVVPPVVVWTRWQL